MTRGRLVSCRTRDQILAEAVAAIDRHEPDAATAILRWVYDIHVAKCGCDERTVESVA